jgi:hypothetical protein
LAGCFQSRQFAGSLANSADDTAMRLLPLRIGTTACAQRTKINLIQLQNSLWHRFHMAGFANFLQLQFFQKTYKTPQYQYDNMRIVLNLLPRTEWYISSKYA